MKGISRGLLDPEKGFTYQNLQDLTRKTTILFPDRSVKHFSSYISKSLKPTSFYRVWVKPKYKFPAHVAHIAPIFCQRVHRSEKCTDIWKLTSSGSAEIENAKIVYGFSHIFNFSSATRGCFLNLTSFFPSMDNSSKNWSW